MKAKKITLSLAVLGLMGLQACQPSAPKRTFEPIETKETTENTTETASKTSEAEQLIHPDKLQLVYPKTEKGNQSDDFFGQKVADPYRWLEKDTDPKVEAWVAKQEKLSRNYLDALPGREALKDRLEKIWNYNRYSAPRKEGGYFYYTKNTGLQNQSPLYRSASLSPLKEELVLDPNTLSKDGSVSLMGLWFSKDGRYLSYAISKSGSDWRTIKVMDLKTKKVLADEVNWVRYSNVSWFENGFFYSRYDANEAEDKYSRKNEFHQLYYHRLGQKQAEDELIFADRSHPNYNFSPEVTEDENYLLIYSTASTSGNGIYYKNLKQKDAGIEVLVNNFDYDYSLVNNKGSRLYFKTNYKAPNYQLLEIDLKQAEEKNWRPILPEQKEALESVIMLGDQFVANYIKDVRNQLRVYDAKGEYKGRLHLPKVLGSDSPVDISSLRAFPNGQGGSYSVSAFTIPTTACTFELKSRKSETWQAPKLAFNPQDFVTRQVFYTYKNGKETVRIPMFITHKKGLKADGKRPTLLYGYGGFNISIMPSFALERIPLLEAGGIFAVANIRGGGEYGKDWHQAGTQLNKQNVFNDFIQAAEYLVKEGYTNPDKLAIEGRSNGGLLVGACMTQRPDLFKVAFPIVGVLDMLRYQEFTIGRFWAADYGLSSDKNQFKNLYAYSPVHNVKAQKYPATMVMTADHDDRVVPAHSFKFAAALQANAQGNAPALLRIDRSAGHGAGKPTAQRIEEIVDKLAFMQFNLMD